MFREVQQTQQASSAGKMHRGARLCAFKRCGVDGTLRLDHDGLDWDQGELLYSSVCLPYLLYFIFITFTID